MNTTHPHCLSSHAVTGTIVRRLRYPLTLAAFLMATLFTQGCIVSRTAPPERPTVLTGTPAPTVAVVIPEQSATAFWTGCGPKELAQEIEKSFAQAGYQACVTVKPKAEFATARQAAAPTTLYIQIADKTPGGQIAWGVLGALSLTIIPSYATTEFIMSAQMGGVTTVKTGTVSDFVWLPLLPVGLAGGESAEVAACVRETTAAVIADLQSKNALPKASAAK